jgi:hypothetical protein
MANIDLTEAAALLNASLGATAYTVASTKYLALVTTQTPSTGTVMGSEVSGGSYARQTIAFAAAATSGSVSQAVSNTAQTFSNMPATATYPVGGVEIHGTSTGTTRRLWYGTLAANKTTAAGDTLSFASGAVTGTLA